MELTAANVYKSLYRKKIKKVLSCLSAQERKKQSRSVCLQVFRDSEFRHAKSVCVYSALPFEIQTADLMKSVIRSGKKLFLPRVDSKTASLNLFEVQHPERDLKSGSFGIQEPDPVRCRKASPHEIDLWILPGLAFDLKGRRLGRGAGYFDRFFVKLPKVRKWALAYREQILPEIPTSDHDVCVDRVIVGR